MQPASKQPTIVIVGGVAGGASAAARARRLAEHARIIVLERGPHASYANCGLPYYIGGEIAERQKLFVAGAERLAGWLDLDVRTGCNVTGIDRQRKRVLYQELSTGAEREQAYDYLILSPGAAPIRPAALLAGVGGQHPRVLSLRSVPDADRIKAVVDGGIQKAVVVGGGFIGLEVAEQLVGRGVATTIVEMLPQVMPPLDAEMASFLYQSLREHGVALQLGDGVAALHAPTDDKVEITLNSGLTLAADLAILAIGVRPETTLASEAGLELNERGAIRVNEHLQTSDPAVYAVGDAIEVAEPILGGKTQIPLAGPANRQGRLAAEHALASAGVVDRPAHALRYRGSQGTSIVGLFDLAAGMTGLSEKSLQRLGKKLHQDYEVVYVHPGHHADYYPGAKRMTLKLVFERPSGRVLGAQAVGAEGIDKRIDVIAMAIQMKATVYDLQQAELCYAPQFGSAKDPVNQAGFQAANVLEGLTDVRTPGELASAGLLLDVRTEKEFAAGHIPGARHIPLVELRNRLAELPRSEKIVVYCALGQRGYLAERILKQEGFADVANLTGGYRTWQQFQ